MALSFGSDLDDVSADPDSLRDLLAAGSVPDDARDLDDDPDSGLEEPTLGQRLAGSVRGAKAAAKPVRVTKAMRDDVRAKTAMLLGLGAGAWSTRDPLCGTVAMEQVPAVSDALADIFCDSPDIVRWFSAGSGYLKWLNLAAALQPLAAVVVGHHITHTIRDEDRAPEDWSGYAAA